METGLLTEGAGAVKSSSALCLHLTFSGTWDQLDLLQGKKGGDIKKD